MAGWMRVGILILFLGLAGTGLWIRAGKSQVEPATRPSSAAEAAQAHHATHLPTKGSERYQYKYPAGRKFDQGQVFDPTPPPAAPALGGVREFTLIIEEDVPHEVAPGVKMPAWTINGTVPGPVLRATEGDLLRITLVNKGNVPHTLHFHGIHPAPADGVFELVPPGDSFTYEFVAKPYGIMPYHCHAMPNSQHIHNGLYGMLIIDPKEGRKPMKELAMVMSAFDLDRDGEADFYAWNGRAFQYADHPLPLKLGEPVRMYVMNIFEETMVPHIHGNLFQLYPSGTTLAPTEYTDVKALNIAERAILEFQYDYPGLFMFQCHVTEHMELGLMGWFDVVEETQISQHRAE
ncbi:MAG: multicopper oxidase domain-containing protein [Acidobacteria bacterium]|nr:multicopper oxidase domain-containing protein [Acidobacteriota bacterium]